MIKKFYAVIAAVGIMLILSSCGGSNSLSYSFQQGSCPNGVTQAPYCMSVQVSNNGGGGQTWITSSSYAISGLLISTFGASNIQTPSTSKSAMDPNNCTGSTLAPGANCTFFLKISFESFPTNSTEAVNVNLTYTLNNNLFGGGTSTGSSSFTIYEITNVYAAQSNGWVGIFHSTGPNGFSFSNFFAESFNDPINTSATDTSAYGFLFLGGNVGIYPVGNESGSESSGTSISPESFSGIVGNLFTFSSNLYAVPSSPNNSSVWTYALSSQTWNTAAIFTLGVQVQPNANAISPGGVLYLASKNQVFTCVSTTGNTSCATDALATNSGPAGSQPGTINAIAFPNGGSTPFTGLYIGVNGSNGGLFAESAALNSANNTWVPILNSSESTILPTITAMTTYNNNLYAADSAGNIWVVLNNYPANGLAPTASLVASVGTLISAITADTIGGILYFATLSNGISTLYGCNVFNTPTSCTPQSSNTPVFPVVSISIASQLVTGL